MVVRRVIEKAVESTASLNAWEHHGKWQEKTLGQPGHRRGGMRMANHHRVNGARLDGLQEVE